MPARIFKDGVEVFTSPVSGLVEFSSQDMAFAHRKLQFNPAEWDGSDFFRISNMSHGKRFCSQRVVEAAARFRWPDIVFARSNEHLELNF